MAGGLFLTTRHRVAIAAGAAIVAASGVVAGVLAARPGEAHLTLASFFDVGPVTRPSPSPGQYLGEQDAHEVDITYSDGGMLRYVFALHNDGPEPLTVTEVVAPPPSFETLLRPVAMGLAAPGLVIDPAVGSSSGDVLNADDNLPAMEPFHSFLLGPGEDRAVYVWARMGNCEFNQPGSAETLWGVQVRYTVRGDARETRLTLPLGIRVNVPLDVRCPRRSPFQQGTQPPGLAPRPATPAAVPPG